MGSLPFLIFAGGAVVVAALAALLYNSLISKRNQVKNVFASIDALLKKRYDLIPNLVAAVQEYMKHERGVLTQITEMRARAVSGTLSDEEKLKTGQEVSKLLAGIRVAVENYPDLKANQNFLQLQGSINEVEEQISAARRAYNAAVTEYHNALEMFPTNLLASLGQFQRVQWFEAAPEERAAADVKGLFKA